MKKSTGLAIVADDLTGAMDSSGHFACLGFSTVVFLDPDFVSSAQVVAVTTNSRAQNPETARSRVHRVIESLAGRIIYKKIDSTLRGNIGIELEAIMERKIYEKILVAPAFPSMGRTTEEGILLVDGIPVSETSFAEDPILPVRESHIPTLLEQSMKSPVGCVGLQENECGPEAYYEQVSGMSQKVVVCDVKSQAHLETIAQAALFAEERWLLCGSTGLARETHFLIEKQAHSKAPVPAVRSGGAVLAVVGSRHPVSIQQLDLARKAKGLPVLNVDVKQLIKEDASMKEMEKLLEDSSRLLSQENHLALSTSLSPYRVELKNRIPGFLAEAVEKIMAVQRIGGLFLCGGDIAIEVCRHLGIPAISVRGEIEPGIPAGVALGDRKENIRVVTKAGGFGDEHTLVKSIDYLDKGELL